MELIESYEVYDEYVKKIRLVQKKCETNLFLLPKDICTIIADKRMYLDTADGLINILVDEGYYYHLYYIWNLCYPMIFPKVNKNILIENIYNLKGSSECAELVKSRCLDSGAKFNKRSYQIEIIESQRNTILESEYETLKKHLHLQNLEIVNANKTDILQIVDLWKKYLEVYDFTYISEQLMDEMISRKEILVVRNQNGEVLAAKCMNFKGARSVGYHLVVNPAYRGRGLGKMLMYEWLSRAKQKDIKVCNVWVAENNKVSLSCHLKAGKITDKVSEQYIAFVGID